MITVVIVDDSPTARRHLRETLESDPKLLVLGEAADGTEAMRLIKRLNPDLVTMDVLLKKENGLDVVAAIMAETPRPIVVITGAQLDSPSLVYKAMDAGALEVVPKLPADTASDYEAERRRLIRLIHTLSKVPVATRWATRQPRVRRQKQNATSVSAPPPIVKRSSTRGRILLIGASTGGPPLIGQLLKALPKPFPIPIIVVQHITKDFGAGFADWLRDVSGFDTLFVQRRVLLEPNRVYVAPDNMNIAFSSERYLVTASSRPVDIIAPSIDVLFESAACHFGGTAIGVLLTGMGKDGASGLKLLKDSGSETFVQLPSTCAVPGMPNAAIALGAASDVLAPDKIPDRISSSI